MTLRTLAAIGALVLLPSLQAPDASARTYTLSGDDVYIWNPAGEVRIEAGTGTAVTVDVTLDGRDAGQLNVSDEAVEGHPSLRVLYPGTSIVYPAMGRWSNSSTNIRRDGTWGGSKWNNSFFSRRLTVKGGGSGTQAWADLVVRVPKGRKISVFTIVGGGELNGVDGIVRFDGGSGGAKADGCRGNLSLDLGSGGIEVNDFDGELLVDTGSGSVRANRVHGPSIKLDTGSGGVSGDDLVTPDLYIDTGSGSVDLGRIDAKKVRVDTGSGGVALEQLHRSPDMLIDTGSGSVRVTLPADFSAKVHIETGSGGIRSELPLTVEEKDSGTLRGTIGAGLGTLNVDTGSGGVSVLAAQTATRVRTR